MNALTSAVALLLWLGSFQPWELLPSAVDLDGEHVAVHWNDADSFQILEGRHARGKVRLVGFNALESYGPVHQWGDWTPMELLKVTKAATQYARRRVWTCTWSGAKDHYDRLLIRCPDLILGMLEEGYGHAFEMDAPPAPEVLAAQAAAMKNKKGMWAKGTPKGLLTSVHSADESPEKDKIYNRVADLKTGTSTKHLHQNRYKTCEKVCLQGSCLLYVPFDQRYGPDRADCLHTKGRW